MRSGDSAGARDAPAVATQAATRHSPASPASPGGGTQQAAGSRRAPPRVWRGIISVGPRRPSRRSLRPQRLDLVQQVESERDARGVEFQVVGQTPRQAGATQ